MATFSSKLISLHSLFFRGFPFLEGCPDHGLLYRPPIFQGFSSLWPLLQRSSCSWPFLRRLPFLKVIPFTISSSDVSLYLWGSSIYSSLFKKPLFIVFFIYGLFFICLLFTGVLLFMVSYLEASHFKRFPILLLFFRVFFFTGLFLSMAYF